VEPPEHQRPLILVLGAGASLGAREGLAPKPPLGKNLARYLCDWLDANDRARPWLFTRDQQEFVRRRLIEAAKEEDKLRKAPDNEEQPEPSVGNSRVPFEDLMARWFRNEDHEWLDIKKGGRRPNRHCRKLLIGTQTLLAYAFLDGKECAFTQQQDRMDELLARRMPTVVITLNYDLLLEEALVRARKAYTYPGVRDIGGTAFVSRGGGQPSTDEPIPIFKLHGSINWLSHRSGMVSQSPAVSRATTRPVAYSFNGPFPIAQTDAIYIPPNRHSLFRTLENSSDRAVVAAIYGEGKHVVENPHDVEGHRTACWNKVSELNSADVLVIGLRPVARPDDPPLFCLLRCLDSLQGDKVCVNSSKSDCEEFNRRGYHTFPMSLQDWLTNKVVECA
jgi:hypothetical protein